MLKGENVKGMKNIIYQPQTKIFFSKNNIYIELLTFDIPYITQIVSSFLMRAVKHQRK